MPGTVDKSGTDVMYYSGTTKVTTIASVTSALILLVPENLNRQGLLIYNVPASSLYLRYGNSAEDTARVGNDSTFAMEGPLIYTGPIYGRRNGSATGKVIITEFI